MALYKKISQVMRDVSYLSKDDKVEFGTTKYKAISEEKVTSTVRESLISNGLVILPVEQEHSREGTLSTVNTRYKIVDIDTGEFEILASSGTGADTQDKGVGKAMTYSYKYLLLRTFAIPTGEDPDKISSAELDAKQKEDAEKKRQAEIEKDEKIFPEVKAKYIAGMGSDDGFEDWYEKLRKSGATNAQLNTMLAKQLMNKKKGDG